MRNIKEIIEELWQMDLPAKLPIDDMINLAVQIQRNEILEEGLSNGNLLDIASSIESLCVNIDSLDRTVRTLKDSIDDKQ